MERRGRFFKCDTEIYVENSESRSRIAGNVSFMLVNDHVAILYVKGVISKATVNYNVNRKVYFNYTNESYGYYYHLNRVGDEDYAIADSAPDALFNALIFENKKDFYMAIIPIGNSGYELSEMIFPLAVCTARRS